MLLVLLNLGHGPVLPLQALLLPLSYFLQVVRGEALKTEKILGSVPTQGWSQQPVLPRTPPPDEVIGQQRGPKN